MLNIDTHIINYNRNFLANFCQINNNRYIYFFFSKQIKSFHLCQNEIKKQQKVCLLFQNAKCTSVNKM